VLVLANLCAVIARELRAGEEPSRQDLELFTGSELARPPTTRARRRATLAAAIRRGDLDEALPEAIAACVSTSRESSRSLAPVTRQRWRRVRENGVDGAAAVDSDRLARDVPGLLRCR
jgi:hypothetical protein